MKHTLVALMIVATTAIAQTNPDAWLRDSQKYALQQWVLDARSCMREGIEVQLMNGNRSAERITTFILPLCGGHIKRVMESNGANGEAFVRYLASEEMRRFPALSQSPKARPRDGEK